MGLFESIINCLHELLIIIRIEGKKTRSNFFKKVGFTNSLNARAELGLLQHSRIDPMRLCQSSVNSLYKIIIKKLEGEKTRRNIFSKKIDLQDLKRRRLILFFFKKS